MTMKATDLRVGNYLRNPANGDLVPVFIPPYGDDTPR